MPVQLGAKVHDFSEPTALLSDCHRRIEMFLGSLRQVAEFMDRPLTNETRTALATALRYFQEAAPKHTADEEESLFPRLRQMNDPEIERTMSILDTLEDDHRKADSLHLEVHALGMQGLEQGLLPVREAGRFRQAIGDLASIYEEHIHIEDDVVFPVAKQALTGLQKSDIANEMASRRAV